MPGILTFKTEDVLPLVLHAARAKKWQKSPIETTEPKVPRLILVGDRGVYLMSGGLPRLKANGKDRDKSQVAYAEGCNPHTDDLDECWANKRAIYGRDDGAEYLEWVEAVATQIENGAEVIRIKMTSRNIRLLPNPDIVDAEEGQ